MMGLSAKIRLSPIGFIVVGLCGLALVYYLTTDGNETGHSGESVSIKQLLAASIQLAEDGGIAVRTVREQNNLSEKSKGKTKEGVNDPVTQGDLQSHRAMFYGFRKAFPSVKVLSSATILLNNELQNIEDEYVPVSNVLVWIDPLDATKEYTENLLHFVTTMVCIVVNGKPVAGVIHKPFQKKSFWAWNGHGSSSNLNSKESVTKSDMSSPRIIISRSHAGKVNATARKAFGGKAVVIPAGGAGYKVLSLFDGSADAYVHVTKIKKWDICAGDAILRALGGRMTTLKGDDIIYTDPSKPANDQGLLAALRNHKEFRRMLKL
ncbi:predicted protein [Nematostella vectensis]|uniref:inositol-phosphate phosphatase n=1 Tax=Nematostella vectensis TaxID=45351 RepID=A7SLX4_NEMVE|nr:predicted protein [Nematostella vectensis]|eukprot:XP_001627359.1 predicted protein [Nematostella vectensis]